ncbi:hypothetical protein L1887_60623 [Cichorium endivia]|nr:hypothetical protein L1887_60623 [Cichorium endivia]
MARHRLVLLLRRKVWLLHAHAWDHLRLRRNRGKRLAANDAGARSSEGAARRRRMLRIRHMRRWAAQGRLPGCASCGKRHEEAEAGTEASRPRQACRRARKDRKGRASERPDTRQANARERDGWCVLLEDAEALESLAYAQEPRPERRRAVGPSLVCSAVLSARRFFFFRTGVARVSCLRWILAMHTC